MIRDAVNSRFVSYKEIINVELIIANEREGMQYSRYIIQECNENKL